PILNGMGSSGASQVPITITGGNNNLPPPPGQSASGLPLPPLPSSIRTPPRPRVAPIMVGKVDTSHLAGVQPGDTAEYVSAIFGLSTLDQGFRQFYTPG